MAYQELAELAERHKMEIALKMAQAGLKQGITASPNAEPAQLAQRVLPSVESAISYLYSSNPTEYRSHVQTVTLNYLKGGFSAQTLYNYAAIMVEAILSFIEAELAGPENSAIRQRYQRRLQGLQTLTQTTILSAQAAFSQSQKSPPK